jgi:HSP20 family protein
MADAGTKTQRTESHESQNRSLTPSERTEGIATRYGGGMQRSYSPSIFSVSPGEFFTMNPIGLIRRFTEDIDRAFSGAAGLGHGSSERDFAWMPAVEVRQSGNNLMIHADLPGLTENDVKVEATDEGLVLQGERKREHTSDEGGWHRSERVYGRFHRLIPLPEGAKVDEAKADFKNGVLEINVPLTESATKRRQIPIGTSAHSQSKAAAAGR